MTNTPSTPESLALIDVAHIFRSAWHASADEALSSAYEHTIKTVCKIVDHKYDFVVAAIDAPPYKRKDLYPEYKANRAETDPGMHEQYLRVQRKLAELGLTVWKVQGYEADDIIATACKHAEASKMAVHIHTADKDLAQLITARTSIVSTRTGEVMGPDEVQAKWGVAPNKMGELLALMGDKSDNIPGCPGVGVKTAAALLKEHGTIEGVLAATITGKIGTALAANRMAVLTSHALVELMDDAPIVWGELFDKGKGKAMAHYEDEERAAIQAEGAEVPEPASDIEHDTPKAYEPTPNPGLVKTRGELAPVAPVAPMVAPAVTVIQLRPGLTVDSKQLGLYKTMSESFAAGGLYRRKFENAQAIFTVMMLGLEIGISPQVALQQIHMIEGKPCPGAHILIAMAKRDPLCAYLACIEENDTSCTYETKYREGYTKEQRFTYTYADAQRDGHKWAQGNNGKNVRAMVRKTAGSQAARLWYPEACSGLYSIEEMGHDSDEVEKVA